MPVFESATKTQFTDILSKVEVFPILGFELNASNTIRLDLSTSNIEMEKVDLTNTPLFGEYITSIQKGFKVGVGGYMENRFMYKRSSVFDNQGKSRSLHLGVDLWSSAYTKVFTPIEGKVHSFAFNDRFGDYGATIILQHEIDGVIFHSLYGHLSLESLNGLREGQIFKAGQELCRLGEAEENGHWPPHLHFQLIVDMQGKIGDYAGVAPRDEEEFYRLNCPDPNLVLRTSVLA